VGWIQVVRAARSKPDRCTVEVVGAGGEAPRVALAVDRSSPDAVHIRFLRALSGALTGTLLRRVLADVVETAREQHLHDPETLATRPPETLAAP
jgi:hypothetical protein